LGSRPTLPDPTRIGHPVISTGPTLFPVLQSTVEIALATQDRIPEQRRTKLAEIARFIEEETSRDEVARLTFICTHNSRRSHMSQIWAQTAAHYLGVPRVETFSGGTEATAFNPRAAAALERAGFQIESSGDGDNPVYLVKRHVEATPIEAFSKVYDQPPNPRREFGAVMTCSTADLDCPVVHGAVARFAIPYDDPKAFDGTDREAAIYDERCRQIAGEMLFLFAQVTAQLDTPTVAGVRG